MWEIDLHTKKTTGAVIFLQEFSLSNECCISILTEERAALPWPASQGRLNPYQMCSFMVKLQFTVLLDHLEYEATFKYFFFCVCVC